jgi:4-diphosphocytidyl-2-C-methyl-D-erythritol kinase
MVSRLAPAKINLTLKVVGRRPDGLHELESLIVFADLGDRLSVAPGPNLSLTVSGPFSGALRSEPNNLVLRAAEALKARYGPQSGARITLEKVLPVASGMGGGSADAASALLALCRHWGLDPDRSELDRLALSIGADVPVCLLGRPAWVRGIGEEISPLRPFPQLDAVLVNPGVAVSTAEVFGALSGPFRSSADHPPAAPNRDGLITWLSARSNDLEAPARSIEPAIGKVLETLGRCEGCGLARMSGSGATCFGLFDDRVSAQEAAIGLRNEQPNWWVRPAVLGGRAA